MDNEVRFFTYSDRTYGLIKRLVQVVLPAISSAYFALSGIWDLPAGEQVVGTIAVITTFLGVSLGISSKSYEASGKAYDGNVIVTHPPDGPTNFLLEVEGDLDTLDQKDHLAFRVKNEDSPIYDQDSAPEGDIS